MYRIKLLFLPTSRQLVSPSSVCQVKAFFLTIIKIQNVKLGYRYIDYIFDMRPNRALGEDLRPKTIIPGPVLIIASPSYTSNILISHMSRLDI